MKRGLLLCLLLITVGFSQIVFASPDSIPSETEVAANNSLLKTESTSQKATSNASIGFSTKSGIFGNSENGQSKGRLPTTGESIGMGLSLLGLLLIIIAFRKELKEIIKNKKSSRGAESK